MNLARQLVQTALSRPNSPAIACGSRALFDYRALAQRVGRLAASLRTRLKLASGDRIALAMTNVPQYVEVLYATWYAGLVAVPINAKLHPREIVYILENSGARVCFATSDHATALGGAPLPASLERLVEVPSQEFHALAQAEPEPIAERAPDDVAWLFYTSGTTGRPKGVMLTHRNLTTLALCYLADVDTIHAQDSIIHGAPMSHGSGLYIHPHIAKAACNVVPESGGFDPSEICSLLSVHRGVAMFQAPTMVRRFIDCEDLARAPLASLKTIVFGGGPMYVSDLKNAHAALGDRLVQIYGQGESPMTITCLSRQCIADQAHPRYEARLASVGLPHTGMEVMVVDVDGRPLKPGDTGEVVVRGDAVMKGYWNNPEATADALRGGWLHTGDVGSLDEEGFLTLRDRSKDLIISGGSNIYPREVEEVLLRHPLVREASVVGRSHPEWGEEVVAFIVAAALETRRLPEELDRLCLDNIARFKRPREYRFIDSLPKNNYGKVLKTELRKMLAQGRSETASNATAKCE